MIDVGKYVDDMTVQCTLYSVQYTYKCYLATTTQAIGDVNELKV